MTQLTRQQSQRYETVETTDLIAMHAGLTLELERLHQAKDKGRQLEKLCGEIRVLKIRNAILALQNKMSVEQHQGAVIVDQTSTQRKSGSGVAASGSVVWAFGWMLVGVLVARLFRAVDLQVFGDCLLTD